MRRFLHIAPDSWQRTLAVMFVAQMIAAIGFSAMFPFIPLYVEALGSQIGFSTEFWSGLVISVQGFTMMLAAPIWGVVADRYGRKLMAERAMFGGAVILFLMAFVQSAEQLVLLRGVQGLVTGTVSASNALVAAAAPRERSGFAMGMLQVGLWTGISLGPFIGGFIADAFGFHAPFILTGALLAVAGVLVFLFVSEPEGETLRRRQERRAGLIAGWRHVLAMPGVVQTYTIRFFTGVGRSVVSPILALFLATLLPVDAPVSTVAGTATGIASIASTLSAIYLGQLGDRIGHRKIVIASALGAAVAYVLQAFIVDPWLFLASQALLGAAAGGLVAGPSALLAHFTEPGEEGTVYGLDNSIVAAGRAVAPLGGAVVAEWFGYRGAFAASGLMLFVTVAVAFWTLPRSARALRPAGD
ncbi:MAG: MFS transporter [Anaerolineae bacterium]|nr:MFS transporter [Anaerolineae bacterium]